MAKPIDEAPQQAIELREALTQHFMRDGVLDTCEIKILEEAQSLYLLTELAHARYRVGIRVLGGGAVDNTIMCQVRDLLRVCEEQREGTEKPCADGNPHRAA
jgi:hypothetical protein